MSYTDSIDFHLSPKVFEISFTFCMRYVDAVKKLGSKSLPPPQEKVLAIQTHLQIAYRVNPARK